MKIDSLTHVTSDGDWYGTGHDASLDRLLREMDKASMDKAVVVAMAGYIPNDYVFRVCSNHADRLIPGASLNPCSHAKPEQAACEAESVLGCDDFPVLKLHPRMNGYDPLDERCLALLETLRSRKVKVWLDSIFRNGKCLMSKPPVDTMHTLLQTFPDVDFVLLHGGGPLLLQMAELLTGHPNLTLDLSLTINQYRHTSISNDILYILNKREMRT
ncbi:MAG: amidohydrolase, partial [Desulfobulbaceae bacterium]|nr:amidohydrolase [Desulfobulbaceae bacterium]